LEVHVKNQEGKEYDGREGLILEFERKTNLISLHSIANQERLYLNGNAKREVLPRYVAEREQGRQDYHYVTMAWFIAGLLGLEPPVRIKGTAEQIVAFRLQAKSPP
jgi:hypothetical protein